MLKKLFSFFILIFLIAPLLSFAKERGFRVTNEMIYQKLIEIEKRQSVFEERFKQIDKRYAQIDKRFEDINKRFEDINRRFEDINKRFEDINSRFEDINKRFEELRADINKRFEDMNKRFEEMMSFLKMIVGIFTALTAAVIGFAYWDRRTIIRKAREETIEFLEREGSLRKLTDALKELAKEDRKLAEVLRSFGLL